VLLADERAAATVKTCGVCKKEKPVGDFSKKNKLTSLYSFECKSCHAIYRKSYYENNKQTEINRARDLRKKNTNKFKEWKGTLMCIKCGFAGHHAALHFHHRDPSEKEFSLSRALTIGVSKDRILAEIAKCDVLCANCHAIEHGG
jgi:hypothetical protein